jgi:hypothetical protein
MFRNVFLIDITEHRGLEQSAISSVQAYASDYNPELIDWFKLPHQVRPELGNGGTVFSGLETGLQLWPTISQRIVELSKGGYAGSVFHVISYDPSILTESRKLSRADLVVRTTPLAVLITKARLSSAPSTNVRRPAYFSQQFISSPALPLQEALELTKRVLKRYGHTSQQTALLQVQLRPLLTREDLRAKKNPRDRNSSRLISNIISEGVRIGCIRQYNVENIPGTDRIWLDESTRSSGQDVKSALHLAGGIGAIQTSIEAISAPLAAPLLASADSRPGITSTSEDTTVESERSSTDAGKKRTRVVIDSLKKAGVFSPKQQRDKLFRALRTCLPDGGTPKTLLVLSREIRREASKPSVDPEFPHWHPATDGMVGMLLGAEVLIDENGAPVRNGLFANGTLIGSFLEQLEDRCEAFLLQTAIKELKDVTKRDKIPLAHALFWKDASQSSRDQVEERLEYVMTLLEDKLAETSQGVWYIKSGGYELKSTVTAAGSAA